MQRSRIEHDPCLNLTVGKGDITPKLNVEEGDTLTGTATVVEAVNPVETHVWELDGSEAPSRQQRNLRRRCRRRPLSQRSRP